MQFLSLLVIYVLNIFVAVWTPLPVLAYMLAAGNLIRVVYVLSYAFNPEKLALMGMPADAKMLKCDTEPACATPCPHAHVTDRDTLHTHRSKQGRTH